METSGGIQASLAGRYASALFGLARDEGQIDAVGRSLEALGSALAESAELRQLVESPLVDRKSGGSAFSGIAAHLKLDKITANFLAVLAGNGRKGQLMPVIRSYRRLAAEHRGETIAEVVTARPLKDDQLGALRRQLKDRSGGTDVTIDARVDPAILGGITVKLESQLIDASIRSKLNRLALAMKG